GRRLGRGGGRLPRGGGGVVALPSRFGGRRWTPGARGALLVAVGGGGSGPRLWLLDPEGRLLGRGEGGTYNPTAAGVGAAVRAIAEADQKTGLALEGERLAADGLAGEPSREAGARPVEAAGPSPDGVW